MESQQHRVIGLYDSEQGAAIARARLQAEGFSPQQLRLRIGAPLSPDQLGTDDSNDVLTLLVNGGAQGLIAGTLAGLGFALMIAFGDPAPVAGRSLGGSLLPMLLGGGLGALVGALLNTGWLLGSAGQRIARALRRGQVVLIVHPISDAQSRCARRLLR